MSNVNSCGVNLIVFKNHIFTFSCHCLLVAMLVNPTSLEYNDRYMVALCILYVTDIN